MMGDGVADVRRRRGGLPLGFLGAAALAGLIEWGVSRPAEDRAFIPASWAASARASAREAAGAAVLCLGDSQVKCGLLPGVIGRRLGVPVYNLAVVGGQAPSTYELFAQALRAGARPRAVVVDYYPGLLGADCQINTRQWPELLGFGGCLDLIVRTRDRHIAGPLLAGSLVPTLRRRDGLRAGLVAGFRGVPDPGRAEALAYLRNWGRNAGAHAMPDGPGPVGPVESPVPPPPGVDPASAGARWRCKVEHAASIRRFLRLAAARGVAVYWLLPTTAPALSEARRRDGRGPAYERFVRGWQAEFSGLRVLDPSAVLSDPADFHDALHVDRRGAVALSASVAEALAGPPPGRWVDLRPAPDRPDGDGDGGPGLEDVGQSALALGSPAGRRR